MPCGIADCTTEAFDEVMNVNVRGIFLCLRAEIRAMLSQEPISPAPGRPQQRGSIVNMGSIASHTVIGPLPAYTTSKHAILGLTRYAGEYICLRQELLDINEDILIYSKQLLLTPPMAFGLIPCALDL